MIVAVDRAVVGHGVSSGAIDSIQQAVIDYLAAVSLRLIHSKAHEIVTKSLDTFSGENTENVSLRMRKLSRSVSTKAGQVFAEECLYSGQREVSQSWTIVKKCRDALFICQWAVGCGGMIVLP